MMQVAMTRVILVGACPPRRPSRVLDRHARRMRAVRNREVKSHELLAVSVIREAEGEKHRAVIEMRAVTVTQDVIATQGPADAKNAARDVRPLVRTLKALKPAAMRNRDVAMNRDVAIGPQGKALPTA